MGLHDIGGFLDESTARQEERLRSAFEGVSKLDRRTLDRRRVLELLRCGSTYPDQWALNVLNDSVNSAELFMRLGALTRPSQAERDKGWGTP